MSKDLRYFYTPRLNEPTFLMQSQAAKWIEIQVKASLPPTGTMVGLFQYDPKNVCLLASCTFEEAIAGMRELQANRVIEWDEERSLVLVNNHGPMQAAYGIPNWADYYWRLLGPYSYHPFFAEWWRQVINSYVPKQNKSKPSPFSDELRNYFKKSALEGDATLLTGRYDDESSEEYPEFEAAVEAALKKIRDSYKTAQLQKDVLTSSF